MKKINLKTYYSIIYHQDTYYDVPDKIAALLKELRRNEHAYYERRRFNNAYYSLNMGDGIEREIVMVVLSPQDIYEEKLNRNTLYSAILELPEKQMKRLYAHYFLDISISRIARKEGVDESSVRECIRRALKRLKKEIKKYE